MIELIQHNNINYPKFQSEGFAAKFVFPFAREVCAGFGVDCGCNRDEWAYIDKNGVPAIKVDPAINPQYDALNFPWDNLDYVFSSHMLEHVANWVDVLDHWHKKLKRGGVLFLYLPSFSQTYWRPYSNRKHIHSFTRELIYSYLVDRGWGKIFLSEIDLNNSFAVMAEKIKPYEVKLGVYNEGNTLSVNQTLVSDNRIANIIMYSHKAKEIPGDYAEFGVFKGGTLEVIAKVNPEKYIHAIDSFAGLPAPSEVDIHVAGDFKEVNLTALEDYFAVHHSSVNFHKGFSPDVFAPLNDKIFAFVHIDVDLYQSVLDACNFFYPRMSAGGIMIFDDYKWVSTPGAEKAISEYFADKEPKFKGELTYIDGTPHYQYMIIA